MADLFATLDRLGIEPDNSTRVANTHTLHFHASRKADAVPSPQLQTREGALRPSGTAETHLLDAVGIGDRVAIQYLDDRKQLTITLTKDHADDSYYGCYFS